MSKPMSPVRSARKLALVALAFGAGAAWAASGGGGGGGGSNSGSSDADMPGEVMVKLRSTQALQPLLARHPLTLVGQFGARPIYRFRIIGPQRVKDMVGVLAAEPDVMIAESNPTHRSPEARKNVSWFVGTQTAYAAQWAPQALHLPEAQALAGGAGVRVAVLDTGVDFGHPALAGRLLPGRDFVDGDLDPSEGGGSANAAWGHGTHVAGLVALAAPAAKIMPVRVLDADGGGNAWVLGEALLWALDPDGNPATDDGAQVINLSLGSLSRTRIMDTIAQIAACEPQVTDDPILDRTDPGYADDDARCVGRTGALVVAAAGNDASGSVKEYPAAESAYGLLSVGAVAANGRSAEFTNYGPWVTLAAPGEGITSTMAGGGYATWSGTSMAAPLVSGVAALVKSVAPRVSSKDMVQRFKRASAQLCDKKLFGLDAVAAVTDSRQPQPPACP